MIYQIDYYIDVSPFAVSGPYQVQLTFNSGDYPFYDAGVATIGTSVEYPSTYYGIFSFNLKLRKIIITHLSTHSWGVNSFYGPVITSLTSGANLPQPAYFISSTAANPGILTSTATTISLNWQNLILYQGEEIVIGW